MELSFFLLMLRDLRSLAWRCGWVGDAYRMPAQAVGMRISVMSSASGVELGSLA
jgi:hypothetical protein